MPKYSNTTNVPLSLAVFLATDNYDYNSDPHHISATSLIKSVRQIILTARIPQDEVSIELEQMISSRIGTAIHDAIERAWIQNYQTALQNLGYPKRIIERIRINPDPAEVTDDIIPIYLEQRTTKQVGNFLISGKFDFVGDGRVEDFKTTSVYTAINHTNDEKYILQGSIYRWLNPQLITKDEMAIQFIFTDWSAAKARTDPNYPQKRIQQRILKLKSIAETDAYVRRKISLIERYWNAPEEEIPECSDADLWRSEPVFKYFKNPAKMIRSTKNYATRQEANQRLAEDGFVGVVVEQPGQVTACKYCSAFPLCTQKDRLIAAGDLVI